MSELKSMGAVIIDGPFSSDRIDSIRQAYDAVLASAPASQVRRGSSSTRFSGLAALKPFHQIYLHAPLLTLASERIGASFQLSSFVGRTLHPHTSAPPLHQDVQRGADGDPLVGFIFMVDAFTSENGATRFLPGSQDLPHPPQGAAEHEACGPAGSMLVFDGLTWHEHGANRTTMPRRSVQGYFVRRDHRAAVDWPTTLTEQEVDELPAQARALLGI